MTTENNQATPPDDAAAQAAAAAAAEANKAPLTLEAEGTPPADKPTAKEGEPPKEPAKGDEVAPVQYNPTGDAGLDMVLKFVGDLGYAPDNPAMAAAINGDFTMLEAELASKGVKGYEAYVKLGQQAYTRTTEATKARQAADRKAVTDAVGGEESWATIQKWARENATPEEAKEVSTELAAGGFRAKAAAVFLRDAYNRANPAVTDGEGPAVSKTKGQADNTGALSPREYAKAVAAARVGFKGDFDSSPEYKALQARRSAWRG